MMKIAVAGASGRMGRALAALVEESGEAELHAALGRADAEPSRLDRVLRDADGILDFTSPAHSLALSALAAEHGLVHVIGTTGFSADDQRGFAEAAARGARIVKSGNMSLGVTLLAALVEEAARALGPDGFDIEIMEMHHRHKVDAPSGTALLLGEAAARGRGVDLATASRRGRDGVTGARERGTIGFAALRGGSVVGEHRVFLAGDGERVELAHQAEDRTVFARGALKAALWAREKPAGLYSMRDVLGIG